jgi:hypothetical protein
MLLNGKTGTLPINISLLPLIDWNTKITPLYRSRLKLYISLFMDLCEVVSLDASKNDIKINKDIIIYILRLEISKQCNDICSMGFPIVPLLAMNKLFTHTTTVDDEIKNFYNFVKGIEEDMLLDAHSTPIPCRVGGIILPEDLGCTFKDKDIPYDIIRGSMPEMNIVLEYLFGRGSSASILIAIIESIYTLDR